MSQSPPAGWYPDPQTSGRERWWDGLAWGGSRLIVSRHPSRMAAPSTAAGSDSFDAPPPTSPTTLQEPPDETKNSKLAIGVVVAIIAASILGIISLNATKVDSSPAQAKPSAEQELVADLRNSSLDFSPMTDSELVGAAQMYCGVIDGGSSPRSAIRTLMGEAHESRYPRETSYLVGAAIGAICPEYGADFEAIVE